MNKHIKKCVSYALGIILAMGLGLSYAYAVGANDSNAFVTVTEFEAKVAQIEASLDNVAQTIKTTNLDFVMNGPRLQASLIEGMENTSGASTYGNPFELTMSSGLSSVTNNYLMRSNIVLTDQWDGRQSVDRYDYYGGDMNASEYSCKMRYALRSDQDPNIYLIFSYYYVANSGHPSLVQVWYLDISKPYQDYSTARSLTVTFSYRDHILFNGNPFYDTSKSSSYIYTANRLEYMQSTRLCNSGNNTPTYGALANPGTGYFTCQVIGDNVTQTYDFPANSGGMRLVAGYLSFGPCALKRMEGRKYGNLSDMLRVSVTGDTKPTQVYKVFSPQKNCLALKSYMNGEIPIFNE